MYILNSIVSIFALFAMKATQAVSSTNRENQWFNDPFINTATWFDTEWMNDYDSLIKTVTYRHLLAVLI